MKTNEEQKIEWMEMLKQRTDIRIDCVVNGFLFNEEIVLTVNGLEVQTKIDCGNNIILYNEGFSFLSNIWMDDNLHERLLGHYKEIRSGIDKIIN